MVQLTSLSQVITGVLSATCETKNSEMNSSDP